MVLESKGMLKKKKKKDGDMSKGHRSQHERSPNGQRWNNSAKKISNPESRL